ncbi:hypothetical protein LOTGIDRAFT_230924 [Lottia gigantea]|uniref:Transmembrane protein 218 n=1 Tax=Lottia gigantea TaxID=225164 RepID=V4B154_LOTGI|nr:hypothetical protein LOTGIDRAFT_230924 [Lottia gigantea]ESO99981.1 hypothetical protein LOTGIDRAFT_230924 [Lottia gigantea]
MARVLGIGEGLFILAFLWVLCLLLCLVFSRAQGALSHLGPLAIIVAGLVTIILIFIPREPEISTPDDSIKIYDYSIIYRFGLIAVVSLFIIIGGVLYLTQQMMIPVLAKPIRRVR